MNLPIRWMPVLLLLTAACGSIDDDPSSSSSPAPTLRAANDVMKPSAESTNTAETSDLGSESDATTPPVDMPATDHDMDAPPTPSTDDDMASSAPPRVERRLDWGRGHRWVRENPMFISGLTVLIDGVDAAFVNAYYDDFGANAIHLWVTGAPNRLGAWLSVPRSDHRWLTWLDNDGLSPVNGQVAGGIAPASAGRIGYQIGDEPRAWADYLEMIAGVATVRAHDPAALIFINMSSSADDLDQMMAAQCADVDIISYDNYSMRQGSYEWLEYFRKWGLQCDRPYWRYTDSYSEPGRGFPEPSGMRWQTLVGLVYGFTGHSWFLYQIAAGQGLETALFTQTSVLGSSRTPLFDIAAAINAELANYGRIVTRLTSTDVRYMSALGGLAQPTSTTAWARGAGNEPYLSDIEITGSPLQDGLIGFFEDNYGERYIMLQNPNHKGGSFPVSTDDDATFTLSFDFASAPGYVDRGVVERFDGLTGHIAPVPLAGSQLVVTLAAGDVYLFKYATTAPWDLN